MRPRASNSIAFKTLSACLQSARQKSLKRLRAEYSRQMAIKAAAEEASGYTALRAEIEKIEVKASAAFKRVHETKATSIAGIIAQIQFLESADALDARSV